MKNLIILCSLLFSTMAFSAETTVPTKQVEIGQDKGYERHSYYFGMVRVNMRSYVNYYVTNNGNTPVRYLGSRISGPGYYANHNCFGVLYPRQRCNFTLEFAPWYEGFHSGQFIMSFDQGNEIVVDLAGQGSRY